jgi:putative hydrolase of the HAD superfamily
VIEHLLLQGVRAIVFDAVGTVIHPEPPAAIVYAETAQRLGSKRTAAEIATRFRTAFAREESIDYANGLRTSEAREVERWRNIVSWVLDDATDGDTCFRQLFEHFSRPHAWRCDADVAATMDSLAARGYVLGLASNYDRRLRSVVAGLPGLGRLRHLIISSEIGWRKPAAQFFCALCQAIALPAETILYVGDDPSNDYEGARAAGLRAALFDPHEKHLERGFMRMRTLRELVAN